MAQNPSEPPRAWEGELQWDEEARRADSLAARGEVFTYNACSADDKVFEDNVTPDPETWSPPPRAQLRVGPR